MCFHLILIRYPLFRYSSVKCNWFMIVVICPEQMSWILCQSLCFIYSTVRSRRWMCVTTWGTIWLAMYTLRYVLHLVIASFIFRHLPNLFIHRPLHEWTSWMDVWKTSEVNSWYITVCYDINGLVQDCSISTLEILQFCTKPSTWYFMYYKGRAQGRC